MHYSVECQYLAQFWQPQECFRICRQLLSVKINQSDAGWPWRGDPGVAPVVQCTSTSGENIEKLLVGNKSVFRHCESSVLKKIDGIPG